MRPRSGPAEIIPFPIVARLAFLDRMAEMVASCRNQERYLDHLIAQQREAMRRRGVPHDAIESEVAAFVREIESRLEEYV